MKKPTISKLFLYRHRFGIGYTILGLIFLVLLFGLPLFVPNGLSEAEMQSAVTSKDLSTASISSGTLVDAPYHALQKLSIAIFGLNAYAIKLPSIIIGALLGFLLILLLNRWFKSNVAIIASILTVLSSLFLSLSGFGTPLIMIPFWTTLLLWLGSKIQGVKKPRQFWCFVFAFALLGSVFTPYLIYLAIFILLFVFLNPHLRFTVKNLPKVPLVICTIFILAGFSLIGVNIFTNGAAMRELMFVDDFSWHRYFNNIKVALLPFFSWSGTIESTFLSPLIGLGSLALAVIGLISTRNGFFASRNSIASYLIFFTLAISGFDPDFAVILILPFAILIAHGIRYILNKWYGLFPENPYARIFGIFPIGIFLAIIIVSDITHFVFGYHYSPAVANNFTSDLVLINQNVEPDSILLVSSDSSEYQFYEMLEDKSLVSSVFHDGEIIRIENSLPSDIKEGDRVTTLGKWGEDLNLHLEKIVTDSKSESSDRLYIYSVTKEAADAAAIRRAAGTPMNESEITD